MWVLNLSFHSKFQAVATSVTGGLYFITTLKKNWLPKPDHLSYFVTSLGNLST
jgi:hypothetical protein